MGKFYLFHLAYNGKNYRGWQQQPDQKTVEGELLSSARKLYKFGRMKSRAASRTDSGVHALSQVVKILLPKREDPEVIKEDLNKVLPPDICVLQARRINPSFRVSELVVRKTYWYIFKKSKDTNGPFPYLSEGVDLERMKELSGEFVGKHDFSLFQHRSDVKGDMKREIFSAAIKPVSELTKLNYPDCYIFEVVGRGFLKQQIRIMVGVLSNMASQNLQVDILKNALLAQGQRLGFIAPSSGLFLHSIEYPQWDDEEKGQKAIVDSMGWKELWPKLELWQKNTEVEIAPTGCKPQDQEHRP